MDFFIWLMVIGMGFILLLPIFGVRIRSGIPMIILIIFGIIGYDVVSQINDEKTNQSIALTNLADATKQMTTPTSAEPPESLNGAIIEPEQTTTQSGSEFWIKVIGVIAIAAGAVYYFIFRRHTVKVKPNKQNGTEVN